MSKKMLVMLVLILSGCATSKPELITKVDPYTNSRQFILTGINPQNCEGDNNFYGSVALTILGGGEYEALSLDYMGASWKFINPKLGLDMLVDGSPMKLQGIPGSTTDVSSYGVKESVYYTVDREIMVKLSQARSIRFRAVGSKGFIEKCLNSNEIASFSTVIPYLKN